MEKRLSLDRIAANTKLDISVMALPIALAFAGGYGDASGYTLADCFSGHITGNTVLVALSIGKRDWDTLFIRLAAIVLFLSATAVGLLVSRPTRANSVALRITVALESMLILVAPAGLMNGWWGGSNLLIACLSLALGLQNGTFRKYAGVGVHTSYVTGDLTTLLTAVTQKDSDDEEQTVGKHIAVRAVLAIWISFAVGAIAAGLGVKAFGARAVWLLIIPLWIAFACGIRYQKSRRYGWFS